MIERKKIGQSTIKNIMHLNIRQRTIVIIAFSITAILGLLMGSFFIGADALGIDLQMKNIRPSKAHFFGTDWLGRDMFARTVKGLTLSFGVGIMAASISTIIALILSLLASINKIIDSIVTWFIDLFLSVPHIVFLILISFAFGGGFKGVIIGLSLTHWPSLTRLLRGEVLQIKQTDYVAVSKQLGKSNFWIAKQHILPHLIPQMVIGFILLFPHAILHEAAITFLGFGLSPEKPAIGIILSESIQYLSTGKWWLAFFPGLSLFAMVGLFDLLGRNVRRLLDPFQSQK